MEYPEVDIARLKAAIAAAGGGPAALDYAHALHEKITALEVTGRYTQLIEQLMTAREQGDFRGRVLEANFAFAFESHGTQLRYGAKQGMSGDIDFALQCGECEVFVEMKLRTQDRETARAIERQLQESGTYAVLRNDDTADIARMQIDLLQKSATRKFNPIPRPNWLNLVGIDVSELQLGAVDICDCILAAAGNPAASQHCHPSTLRESVLGFFESADARPEKLKWLERVQALALEDPHPRTYIHGAFFLFREPAEAAALSYRLHGPIVWNRSIVNGATAATIGRALHAAIPLA